MAQELQNKKIAILVTDGFEQVEMTKPRQAFDDAGATTHLISPKDKTVRGWNHYDKAEEFEVDILLNQANPNEYDALLLPGGVANPDALRMNESAVKFIKAFISADKPVAAICHGPWTLIEAEAVQGKKVTSWPSLKTDLKNAGANWVDEETVIDGNILTSRNPDDIPAFIEAAIALFAPIKTPA